MTDTRTYEAPGATVVYDVRGPLPPADGRPPLMMIGQPMDAGGFATLASHFGDRTVVTYDPRGLGRSVRSDGGTDNDPVRQAEDVHGIIAAIGGGPVDLFASSGGAVTALALLSAHPGDVGTLVAHEPPLLALLPDADLAYAAERTVRETYASKGRGAGMAAFIAMSSWQGPFSGPLDVPDPAAFGLPADDDGARDDPLLSERSAAVTAYRPDLDAVRAAPARIVVAAGEETGQAITARTAAALAEALGVPLTMFPSHHGGFMGGEFGYAGQPEAFAARLREVLDA